MGQLSAQELQLAKDTAKIALANAARSLGTMLKEDIDLINFELDIANSPNLRYELKNSERFFVLETEVIGQMQAHTYLIFSQENALQICKSLLPANLLGSEEMRTAMLLEIDNILAASVVSKFSDILKKDITGHVPKISQLSKKDLEGSLSNFPKQNQIDFSFKVDFVSKKTDVATEFFCFFTNNLKKTVVEQAQQSDTQEELEKNKSDFSSVLKNIKEFINNVFN